MDPINSATEQSAQEIESRIEESLFGKDEEAITNEPEVIEGEEVLEDDESLPADDDSDLDDDDGSEDLDDIANDEDLTLAEYLGIDDDKLTVGDDGVVSFTAVVDGESKEVPLKELAKSFQLQGHVNNKSIALEDERKTFETQRTEVAKELQTRVDGLKGLGDMMEKQLLAEYNGIDWDRLRVENPAEWTAMRSEYAERAQGVKQSQALVQEEGKRLYDEQSAVNQKAQGEHMKDQFNKMILANPTWSNEEVLKSDMGAMRSFVKESYGFADEDMAMVTDHRLIALIQDAQAYRKGKKSVEVKKAKRVPKFQKPGASKEKSAQLAKARGVKANKAAVKKSGGHVRDIAKSIEDRM